MQVWCTVSDAMIWEKCSIIKPRSSSLRVIVNLASFPGPLGFLDSSWGGLSLSPITQEDAALWPCSVNIFLEFTAFWTLCIGPREPLILANLVFPTWSCLSCLSRRLDHGVTCERVFRPHLRACRPLIFFEQSLASISNAIRQRVSVPPRAVQVSGTPLL